MNNSARKHDHFEWWNALDTGHQKWNLLDGRAREAAAVLGYTKDDWDAGRMTHLVDNKDWVDLDSPQQDAAKLLGFSAEKWNRVASSVHEKHRENRHQHENDPTPPVLPSPFPQST